MAQAGSFVSVETTQLKNIYPWHFYPLKCLDPGWIEVALSPSLLIARGRLTSAGSAIGIAKSNAAAGIADLPVSM